MILRTNSRGVDIIRPRAPINGTSRGELASALEPALTADPPKAVVDLSHVDRFDSQGLEEIVDQQARFLQLGGDLKLAEANELCRDILRVSGISDFIEVHANVESAVCSFWSRAQE